jgi:hypothetical protein
MKVTEHHLTVDADPHRIKIIAEALAEYMTAHDIEDDATLSDFRFKMETAYQAYHGLDQDDWDYAKNSSCEEENVLNSELCDLYDVRMFLRLRGLLDEPKDNEGTEETIGELIDNLIEQHTQ